MMTSINNMYRIGDYVYFENSSSNPYSIRRIEEIYKTSNGNVEAKVLCFYRRRDISSNLLLLADKHAKDMEEDMDEASTQLSNVERHQLNHRELYLSRQLDTLPATHIRGKCSITLLNETEDLKSYLTRSDTFFYSLVYDPTQKTLLADKGEIRVGSKYQAEIPDLLVDTNSDTRSLKDLEELTWTPQNSLSKEQLDQYLVVTKAVGTYARALDCNSSIRQPALNITVCNASRDITLVHAIKCLHENKYVFSDAVAALVPKAGPVLCKDELEEWSPSESNLFEEALEKYGKDFLDIKQDFLPWKTVRSIVEYYYMFKTSDKFLKQKRLKATEAESKLKQVYIPNYNKANPNQIKVTNGETDDKACEGCFCTDTTSMQWYTWGPLNMNCRICATCWTYWKKYGGLKMPPSSRLTRIQITKIRGTDKELRYRPPSSLSMPTHSGPRTQRASHKTKQAFFLNATKLTRLARRLCGDILSVRHFSRQPFEPISIAAIKAECQVRLAAVPQVSPKLLAKKWPPLSVVVHKLASLPLKVNQHSQATRKSLLNSNIKENDCKFPRSLAHPVPTSLKRPHQNGLNNHVGNLQSNGSMLQRLSNGPQRKKRCQNATDSSDDILFVCTDKFRELRKQLSSTEQRSAARRPTKCLLVDFKKHFIHQQAVPKPIVHSEHSEPIVID